MIGKKIMGLLLLMVMAMSMVPAAFAQVDTTGSEETDLEVHDRIKAKVGSDNLVNGKMRIASEDGELKPLSKAKINSLKRKRAIKHKIEGFEEDRTRLRGLKEAHKERRSEYFAQGEDAKALQKELKACRESGEDCSELAQGRNQAVMKLVLSAARYITSALDKLENRVAAAQTLDEDEKTVLFEEIATDRLAIEESVESLKEMASADEVDKEEIKLAIKNLKSALKTAHPNFKWTVSILINNKINGVVNNLDESLDKVEERISVLEEAGSDVSELDNLLVAYDEKVAEADANHQAAQDLYISAFNDGGNENVAEEGRALQQAARENLHEAKEILREIFNALHDLDVAKESK